MLYVMSYHHPLRPFDPLPADPVLQISPQLSVQAPEAALRLKVVETSCAPGTRLQVH